MGQKIEKGIVEDVLGGAISDEVMDFQPAEDSAPLEPLHNLLAEERARFLASQG